MKSMLVFSVGVDGTMGSQVFLTGREMRTPFLHGISADYVKHLKYKYTLGPIKHISRNLSYRNNQMIQNVDNPLFLT